MVMKSVTDAIAPVDSLYVVCMISVPGRYRLSTFRIVLAESDQNPCELLPAGGRSKLPNQSRASRANSVNRAR